MQIFLGLSAARLQRGWITPEFKQAALRGRTRLFEKLGMPLPRDDTTTVFVADPMIADAKGGTFSVAVHSLELQSFKTSAFKHAMPSPEPRTAAIA